MCYLWCGQPIARPYGQKSDGRTDVHTYKLKWQRLRIVLPKWLIRIGISQLLTWRRKQIHSPKRWVGSEMLYNGKSIKPAVCLLVLCWIICFSLLNICWCRRDGSWTILFESCTNEIVSPAGEHKFFEQDQFGLAHFLPKYAVQKIG